MYNVYFLLTSFISKDCYYFLRVKSQPGHAYKSGSYEKKKAFNVVSKPSKHGKITYPHGFLLCLSRILLGRYPHKMLLKVGVSE